MFVKITGTTLSLTSRIPTSEFSSHSASSSVSSRKPFFEFSLRFAMIGFYIYFTTITNYSFLDKYCLFISCIAGCLSSFYFCSEFLFANSIVTSFGYKFSRILMTIKKNGSIECSKLHTRSSFLIWISISF